MRNAKGDLKQVREIGCLAEFSDFASEALPYWIGRAEKLEKALERAGKYIEDTMGNCPTDFDLMDTDDCENCENDFAACWKKYFLEDDGNASKKLEGDNGDPES